MTRKQSHKLISPCKLAVLFIPVVYLQGRYGCSSSRQKDNKAVYGGIWLLTSLQQDVPLQLCLKPPSHNPDFAAVAEQ